MRDLLASPGVVAAFAMLAVLLCLLTLPLISSLLVLTTASLFPRRSLPQRKDAGREKSVENSRRLAVIVPAHNEELLVGRCVESLSRQLSPRASLLVIAHNCVDETALRACNAGADVLILNDARQQGKACALRYGFDSALRAGAEAVLVVDADSIVSDGFIDAMHGALSTEAEAVQSCYRVLGSSSGLGNGSGLGSSNASGLGSSNASGLGPSNASGNGSGGVSRPTLTGIAFQGFNLVRPRGRARLGLSAGIFGNGFGMRREVLERVPYTADSVVEDLEYHLQLVRAGVRVHFLEDATVYGEMPQGDAGTQTQRARWEGGRLLMARQLPQHFLGGLMGGNLRLLEPMLDLLSPPIAMASLLLVLCLCLPVEWVRWYGAAGLAVLCFHFLIAVRAGTDFWRGVGVLLLAPRYVFWKLLLLPRIVVNARRDASWVRTERDKPADFAGTVHPDALE